MAISEAERKIFERVIAEVGSDPEKAEATLKVLFNVMTDCQAKCDTASMNDS